MSESAAIRDAGAAPGDRATADRVSTIAADPNDPVRRPAVADPGRAKPDVARWSAGENQTIATRRSIVNPQSPAESTSNTDEAIAPGSVSRSAFDLPAVRAIPPPSTLGGLPLPYQAESTHEWSVDRRADLSCRFAGERGQPIDEG